MADQPSSVFTNPEGTPSEGNVVNTPNTEGKLADLLKSIKNENGEQKYNSVEKALEALGNAQAFIPQLKSQLSEKDQELERIKNELEQRESVEQVVQRLIAKEPKGEGHPPATSGLDEQAVINLVKQTFQQNKQIETVEANRLKVQETLRVQFGDKAGDAVAQKAAELGTTPEELGELASKNPNLVLALFNTQGYKSPTVTVGSHNLPAGLNKPPELKRPEKSLLSGATTKEQKEFMRQVRANVYAKHGIES